MGGIDLCSKCFVRLEGPHRCSRKLQNSHNTVIYKAFALKVLAICFGLHSNIIRKWQSSHIRNNVKFIWHKICKTLSLNSQKYWISFIKLKHPIILIRIAINDGKDLKKAMLVHLTLIKRWQASEDMCFSVMYSLSTRAPYFMVKKYARSVPYGAQYNSENWGLHLFYDTLDIESGGW